jgi:protein-disulfide isomerase
VLTRRNALVALGAATALLAGGGLATRVRAEAVRGEIVLGDGNAPVTIIEYSSLTCPHCARFHRETLPGIKERYIDTGEARLVFRDYPLDQVAVMAAVLARCAGKERFFGFLDVLFRSQKTWARASDPRQALERIGRLGGLSQSDMDACFADGELESSIYASRVDAAKEFDIKSTPTFIINGEMVVGAQPFERFAAVIDRILSEQ